MARHSTIAAGHPHDPSSVQWGWATFSPFSNLIREQGEALAPNCGGDEPQEALVKPIHCQESAVANFLFGWGFFEKDTEKVSQEGI